MTEDMPEAEASLAHAVEFTPDAVEDPAIRNLVALLGRIDASSSSLPPRPEVVAEVMALLEDPMADSRRLARLVHGDPALAAQVLRVANSPAWRGRARITTLQQAVARLGIGTLQEIVLSAAISGVYKVKGHGKRATDVWHHAIGTAIFAKLIARSQRLNVEGAFLGGLLHSVGRPVALWELAQQVRRRKLKVPVASLYSAIDIGHARVGAVLAEAWELPEVVVHAITFIDRPEASANHRPTVGCVALGARMAQTLVQDGPEAVALFGAEGHPLPPEAAEVDTYHDDLAALAEQADKVQAAIQAMSR